MNRIVRMLVLAASTLLIGSQAGAVTPADDAKDSAPAAQAAELEKRTPQIASDRAADANRSACQPCPAEPAKPLSRAQQKVLKDWEWLQALHYYVP
jgi:hypothetical protein